MSKLYLNETRSVNCVVLTTDKSARLCQGWRKMLRWPDVKLVSKTSPAGLAPEGLAGLPTDGPGIAPFKSPGFSRGTVKQFGFKAGTPGVAPLAPVSAFFAVQPGASGTMGFVIP